MDMSGIRASMFTNTDETHAKRGPVDDPTDRFHSLVPFICWRQGPAWAFEDGF
jgi:hypothetical protein